MIETDQGIRVNIDPGQDINDIHNSVCELLTLHGVPVKRIENGDFRPSSLLYMTYWYHRLRNNPEEQSRIRENLTQYIGPIDVDANAITDALLSTSNIQEISQKYVETLLIPVKTVDLVITKPETADQTEKEVLCLEREYYPFGSALPGGIIQDIDEDNDLDLSPEVFAALRVAGEKILGIHENAHYTQEVDRSGKPCFVVSNSSNHSLVRLYPEDATGYRYKENITSTLRPADPRHIVDTVGFKCEVEGEIKDGLTWRKKSEIMSPSEPTGGFAFGHHREIVAHITSKTSLEKEKQLREHEFIRSIIADPLAFYTSLKERFESEGNRPDVSFPELFPTVDRILTEAFSDEINQMCEETPLLAGIRDKAVISLRQVALKNRTFLPYLPTLLAVADGVAFFDLVARQKKGFFDNMPKENIVEHNPRETPYASYHMYRYKYRFDELLSMIPEEVVIPTFETLSATDLMRVRGVPIRFVGVSPDFLYVDEFDQSPEEFFMHDANHSWRMIMEDKDAEKKYGKPKEQLIQESNAFITEYLDHIKIRKTDTEDEREMKKLKKIILFEIVHEDARPFLKEVIGKYIQLKEGNPVPFEVPYIDQSTGYMDIVDTLDTGISTLSYVRNKLQHGFYDHIDAQLPQIVDPKYRTAEWITRAAYDMLIELETPPEEGTELDATGQVSYEWLLKRTCAVGPDNIHGEDAIDPSVTKYGDGATKLNPKRYQVT